MTAPDESRLAHCATCQHRYGAGCGCECCAWAGEAVRAAAEAAYLEFLEHHDMKRHAMTWNALSERYREVWMRVAREAVQAALPGIWAAAVAAERERQDGAARISAERRRQIEQEGWTLFHDRHGHHPGELARAAVAYAANADAPRKAPRARARRSAPPVGDGEGPAVPSPQKGSQSLGSEEAGFTE